MRKPDVPGQYRIKLVDGEYRLSGVRSDGRRVKLEFGNEIEARRVAESMFIPVHVPAQSAPVPAVQTDDWGLPITVDPETIASVASAMGVGNPGTSAPKTDSPVPVVVETEEEDEKKIRENQKRARSLCEFLGVAWASGDVWIARKATKSLDKEPVNPSPKQVNDLAKSAQETFVEWFGDREIRPWQMMILLSIALPASMILQSPPKKKTSTEVSSDSQASAAPLRSVT